MCTCTHVYVHAHINKCACVTYIDTYRQTDRQTNNTYTVCVTKSDDGDGLLRQAGSDISSLEIRC